MRKANKMDIDKIVQIRIKQQKAIWKDEYDDKYNLVNTTKKYLEKHLNNDFYAFVEEKGNDIIAICCLQVVEYIPQCNDNGKHGYICNVYTSDDFRNKGIQTNLLKKVINFAKENLFKHEISFDVVEATIGRLFNFIKYTFLCLLSCRTNV